MTVLTANFIKPPVVGATIDTVRVWSPDTAREPLASFLGRGKTKRTKRGCLFAKNRLEDAHERLGELVLEVVLGVDRDVVLEHVKRILGLLVRSGVFGALDDDVCESASARGQVSGKRNDRQATRSPSAGADPADASQHASQLEDQGGRTSITFPHALGQLDVGLLVLVV